MSRHPRFELADGLRGIGALAMVVMHVAIFTGRMEDNVVDRGLMRLDVVFAMFFVLSAFVLYRPMIAHRVGGPRRPRVGDYVLRRWLRVYPAYWIALVALGLFAGLDAVFDEHAFGAFSLLGNLDPPYAHGECGDDVFRCGLVQTWSLTAEITFYALLPLYAFAMDRLARGRSTRSWIRWELGILAGLSAVTVVLAVEPFSFREDFWFRYSLVGNWLWIATGLALAVVSVAWHQAPRPRALQWAIDRPAWCWGTNAVLWLGLLAITPAGPYILARHTDAEYVLNHVVFGIVGLLGLLPAVFTGDGLGYPRRMMGVRLARWFGVIAFGMFLWHVTIAYVLGIGGAEAGFTEVLVLTLLVTTPIAAASFYLVEQPLSRVRVRLRGAPRA